MKETVEIIKSKIELQQRSIERSRKAIEKIQESIQHYMNQTKEYSISFLSSNLRSYADQLEQEETLLRSYIATRNALEDLLDEIEDGME